MLVDDLQQRPLDDGRCEISARVRRGAGEDLRLWWRLPGELAPSQLDGSPFLTGVLVWAMEHREDVTIDAPVSPRLLAHIDECVAILRSIAPQRLRRVRIEATTPQEPPAPTPVTGCFFSRGADSWFAVLTALEDDPQDPPLSQLVFSPGFLSAQDTPESVRATTEKVTAAAARTGLELLEADTNLKWDFGGAQLVSTALALGFQRMLLPSGAMHGEIVPAITHPVLDHRFSTERTELVHYGDASRLDKITRIARSQDALETLWVCQQDNPLDEVNCGRCEKCVRTMMALHLAGTLDRATTLPYQLDARRVASVTRRLGRRHQWVDAANMLSDRPGDRPLAAAARLVIAHSDLRRAQDSLEAALAQSELVQADPRLPAAARRAADLEAAGQLLLQLEPPNRLQAVPHRLARRLRAHPHAARLLDVLRRGRGD